jgi:hypothetical protein
MHRRRGVPSPARLGGQLSGGAGLPDSRLPRQHHHPSPAREDVVQVGPQVPHHVVAADEEIPFGGNSALFLPLLHRSDEVIAAPMDRLDQLRARAPAVKRLAGRRHIGGQHRLADVFARPERVEELRLGDHPVAVTNQVEDQVEGLGREPDHPSLLAELVEPLVELEFGEGEDHVSDCNPPSPMRKRRLPRTQEIHSE